MLCTICCKEFFLQSKLDHHLPTCIWLHTPRKIRDEQLDEETKLSDGQQDKLIREMMFQMQQMQAKLDKMTQTISQLRSKQKIQIIAWLNSQPAPKESVHTWFTNVPILQQHLEHVFMFDLLAGLKLCIGDYIRSRLDLPFCGFVQKAKTIYVFDKVWVSLSAELSRKLAASLVSRFFETFIQWQLEQEEFLGTEEGQEKDMVFMKKFIGGSSDNLPRTNSLFAWLYTVVQKDQSFVQVVF